MRWGRTRIRSPSRIAASTIESPCTRSMNASEARGTKPGGSRNSPSTSSCAVIGTPAATRPRIGTTTASCVERPDRRAQRARLGRIARDQAAALERLQVGVDRGRGREADALADLPYRGRVAVLGGKVPDDRPGSGAAVPSPAFHRLFGHCFLPAKNARRMALMAAISLP